jgi:hypothetical protein
MMPPADDILVVETPPLQWLRVGVTLQLTLFTSREEVHCSTTLLGWKQDKFVIAELPIHGGCRVDFHSGTPCLVRYFLCGRIVGYRSEVYHSQCSPEPLLFLGFPTRIEEILVRKHPRVRLSQPVAVTLWDSLAPRDHHPRPEAVIGVLHDLSVNGCQVVLTEMVTGLRRDAIVHLEFDLPGIGHIYDLTGIVKNVSQRGDRVVAGLEFKFYQRESIEFRGWGGSVRNAIAQFVVQRQAAACEGEGIGSGVHEGI